jgi:hypothetical protein
MKKIAADNNYLMFKGARTVQGRIDAVYAREIMENTEYNMSFEDFDTYEMIYYVDTDDIKKLHALAKAIDDKARRRELGEGPWDSHGNLKKDWKTLIKQFSGREED